VGWASDARPVLTTHWWPGRRWDRPRPAGL